MATYAAAEAELDAASDCLRDETPQSRSMLMVALRRLRGLVADVAELAAKLARGHSGGQGPVMTTQSATNIAQGDAHVGLQAGVVHIYMRRGTRVSHRRGLTREDVPSGRRIPRRPGRSARHGRLIEQAVARGYVTAEVRFYQLLALLSRRTLRQLGTQKTSTASNQSARNSSGWSATDDWRRGPADGAPVHEARGRHGSRSRGLMKELDALNPRQREPDHCNTSTPSLKARSRIRCGGAWVEQAKAGADGSGGRAERIWMFFHAHPAHPRARHVPYGRPRSRCATGSGRHRHGGVRRGHRRQDRSVGIPTRGEGSPPLLCVPPRPGPGRSPSSSAASSGTSGGERVTGEGGGAPSRGADAATCRAGWLPGRQGQPASSTSTSPGTCRAAPRVRTGWQQTAGIRARPARRGRGDLPRAAHSRGPDRLAGPTPGGARVRQGWEHDTLTAYRLAASRSAHDRRAARGRDRRPPRAGVAWLTAGGGVDRSPVRHASAVLLAIPAGAIAAGGAIFRISTERRRVRADEGDEQRTGIWRGGGRRFTIGMRKLSRGDPPTPRWRPGWSATARSSLMRRYGTTASNPAR